MGVRENRISNGLCPNCGAEAAPFYLCPDCRRRASLNRMMRRGEDVSVFSSTKIGRERHWTLGSEEARDVLKTKPMPLWGEGMSAEDGRLRPRLGRIPVDIEREVFGILLRLGEPATEQEIIQAWGRMRVRRGRASAAGDLVALIKAERRREERNRKRMRVAVN